MTGRHLGIVVPRYGSVGIGGAELVQRELAETLVAGHGWTVEVFTTCATSAVTWDDVLPEGTTTENGVLVHRFRSRSGRQPSGAELQAALRTAPWLVSDSLAAAYYRACGPHNPDMLAAAEASAAEVVTFSPYLFWPTVAGVPRLAGRSHLQPAAHNEFMFHLPLMGKVFRAAGSLSFNTRAEADMVNRRHRTGAIPQSVVGNGVEARVGDATATREALGLGDRPFALCLGRVERGKGAVGLAEAFVRYKSRYPGALRLVFAGPVHEPLPRHPDIVAVGQVSEDHKWGLLAASSVLIQPSLMESFSLVVLEAWLAGSAVVVNGHCPATMEHATRSGAGLWFTDDATLAAALNRVCGDEPVRRRLVAAGRRYARDFTHEAVAGRFIDLIERRRPTGPRD